MVRRVAVLALPGVQLLDVAGPLDVFAEANLQAGAAVYDLAIVGLGPGPIELSSGRRLVADLVVEADDPVAFDTLLVAGAPHMHGLARARPCAAGCRRPRSAPGATVRSAAGRSCSGRRASSRVDASRRTGRWRTRSRNGIPTRESTPMRFASSTVPSGLRPESPPVST